ncbi:MAG: metal-dependent transcriptional regulator [Bacteriovoracaceae bacterium]|nr:metal-dependent transcriptional regulator [Bacteriovoracaceae bacterium]
MEKTSQKQQNESELTHSMVHYLLTIHKLKEEQGYARVTDIAEEMKLTKGSVSTALTSLKKKNLITEDKSKFFSLSEKGHSHVHSVLSSRTLLFYFLKDFVGVSTEVAKRDSCLMEHLMSDETREKFFKFLKIFSADKKKTKDGLDLSRFKNSEEFMREQKGDSYLGGVE